MDIPQIIDQLDETIYLSDPDTYEMIYINEAGLKSIGSRINLPYEGQPCYHVLQGRQDPCPFCTNHLLAEDRFYVWEYTNPLLDRHFILKDKLLRLPDGGRLRLEIAIDITEWRHRSENIREQLEMQMALVSCLRYLSPPNAFEDGIRQVLGELGKFHKADRAYIVEFAETTATNTYEWCAENVTPQIDTLQNVPISDILPVVEMLQIDRLCFVADVEMLREEMPALYDLLRRQQIRSLLSAPLFIKKKLVGMIGVDNPSRCQRRDLLESLSFFVVSDLKKRRAEEALSHTRRYDPLTELKNHSSYMQCLDALRAAPPASLGVVLLDINGLKQINKWYGPAYGDTYIGRVAGILKTVFSGARLFRTGGDEFSVLWENVPHEDFQEAVRLLDYLLKQEQDFSVSVGSTWAGQDIHPDDMLNYADQLLSLHKQDFYSADASRAVPQKNALLRRQFLAGLEAGSFVPYLQPKAHAGTGALSGAEILVRCLHPVKGVIPPGDFIVRLEREGLIKHLDYYMIRQTCDLLERWNDRGTQIPVSVNVSRITLMEAGFVERLKEIQKPYHFPRRYLELEATERVGKIERKTLIDTAVSLRREGFTISLDDFGAEYSNLSLLTTLEMDVVKLDKSLIDEVARSEKSAALAECIVNICHRFGMRCIAEGVETQMQLETLRRINCDEIQGYLLSPPIPVDAFEQKYRDQLFQ